MKIALSGLVYLPQAWRIDGDGRGPGFSFRPSAKRMPKRPVTTALAGSLSFLPDALAISLLVGRLIDLMMARSIVGSGLSGTKMTSSPILMVFPI